MKAFLGNIKTMINAALLLVLVTIAPMTVMAFDTIDFSQQGEGEISVTIKDNATGEAVGGGSLTIYKVADVVVDNGYKFDASGTAFKSAGGDYSSDEALDAALAAKLADYAKKQKIAGDTLKIGSDGVATASNLDFGLYLIVQNKAAKGYGSVKPFLVSVPQRQEDGTYLYKVDATPKPGTKIDKNPTPTPTRKPTSTPTPTPFKKIPQTGQLWWPVFAMAVAGVLCLVVGMAVKRR